MTKEGGKDQKETAEAEKNDKSEKKTEKAVLKETGNPKSNGLDLVPYVDKTVTDEKKRKRHNCSVETNFEENGKKIKAMVKDDQSKGAGKRPGSEHANEKDMKKAKVEPRRNKLQCL